MPKPYSDPARKAWPFLALFVVVGAALMIPFGMQAVRDYRIARANGTVGTLRPESAAQTRISPRVRVLAGLHDSSASLQAARCHRRGS